MAQQVQAPSRKPRVGGLKDVVGDYIQEDRLGGPATLAWEDATCGFPALTKAGCYDDVTPAEDKEFQGYGQYEPIAPASALYAGVECWIGGDTDGESYPVLARTKLEQGEDRALEGSLATWAAASSTSATVASLAEAVAEADRYADANYVGLPLLLMPRDLAVLAYAAYALTMIDGRLVTPNGTPVLATSSYPSEDDAVSIIGWPAVYASQVISREVVSPQDNLGRGLAERVYAIGVDCNFRYTVTVTAP